MSIRFFILPLCWSLSKCFEVNAVQFCLLASVIKSFYYLYGTSLLILRPFSVIRQIFLRHLLSCLKLLQLNLHLLASVIIHHQEQYMPLT